MGKKLALFLVTLFAVTLISSNVFAMKMDLELWRHCVRETTGPQIGMCKADANNLHIVEANNKKFGDFSKQFAAVLSPKYHSPAETLGWAGWNLGMEFTLNKIPGGEHWDDALEGIERFEEVNSQKTKSSPSLVNSLQFHARKGLPFSTELGFTISYLLQSKMYTAGFEFKFAFVEGFTYVPDMAVRLNYNHLFGTDDMDMNIVGWDFSISKNFGLGGFIQLAPYTGYSFVYSMASPHVLNPTFDNENNDRLLLLDDQNHIIHRWFIGLRIIATYVSFTPEVIITSAEVYNFSFNLGSDF